MSQGSTKNRRKRKGVNPRVTRIEHIDRIRKAYIMHEDKAIAEIWHEYSSLSGEEDWVIRPYWDVWDWFLKEKGEYLDITGIDDRLRLDEYIRRYEPSFVSQRVIPEGRPELFGLLEELGLTYRDPFEIMCRTHGVCGNDDYYVSRTPDKIVNVYQRIVPYDIPDFDTSDYGWL